MQGRLRSSKVTLIVTGLLLLAAVAAFPCAASAAPSSGPAGIETGTRETDQAEEVTSQFAELRLPEFGPLVTILIGVTIGLIVEAITHPSTTARIAREAISFVAEAYEQYGKQCVGAPNSCSWR